VGLYYKVDNSLLDQIDSPKNENDVFYLLILIFKSLFFLQQNTNKDILINISTVLSILWKSMVCKTFKLQKRHMK